MEIKFSRHAKRRGKLYKISEEMIRKILEGKELIQGNQEIDYRRGGRLQVSFKGCYFCER